MTIKIASWNINSIRARISNVTEWLSKNAVDILMLQELKATEEQFPYDVFKKLGYHIVLKGQKSWNGVAILAKKSMNLINDELAKADEQARYLEVEIDNVRYICIYAPNGNPVNSEKYPYKLRWFDELYKKAIELKMQEIPFIIGGDFNIIPEEKDCYDPNAWQDDALFTLETRKKYRQLINLGLTDAYRAMHDDIAYSFWDYQAGAWQQNKGIRIDHFLVSPKIAEKIKNVTIDKEPRGKEKASDHTPIILEIEK